MRLTWASIIARYGTTGKHAIVCPRVIPSAQPSVSPLDTFSLRENTRDDTEGWVYRGTIMLLPFVQLAQEAVLQSVPGATVPVPHQRFDVYF